MSAGTVQNPSRPRYQSNERFDVGDASASSEAPREFDTSLTRSIVSTSRNVGSTSPVGLIIRGFDLTLNPTAPNDNEVEVNSDLGVALDSDGNLLIKEAGTELTFTLTTGTWQLYIYFQENATNLAKRRFTPVTGGAEFTQAIDTTYTGTINTYVRAGDNTSVVAQDNVNGATTPLCLLAVVIVSSGGAVTCVEGLTAWATTTAYAVGNPVVANGNIYVCQIGGLSASTGSGPSGTGSNINDNGVVWTYLQATGQNSSTAPNGTCATNRLSAVIPPAVGGVPKTPFVNGSVATLHDMVQNLAYFLGQIGWRGSRNMPPSSVNNYQAFAAPTVGLDALFDSQGEAVVTPTTRYRDWNLNLRSLVDHNGYRMGQVSERDENWADGSTTIVYPLGFALPNTGSAWAPQGVNWVCGSGGGFLYLSLDGVVPPNAVISDITIYYDRGNSGDVTVFDYVTTTASTSTTRVSETISTGTGAASYSFGGTSPTVGQLPQQLGSFGGSAVDMTYLAFEASTITSSLTISKVTITYYVPTGWTYSNATLSYNEDNIIPEDPGTINQRAVNLFGFASSSPALAGSSVLELNQYETEFTTNVAYVMEFMLQTGNSATDASLFAGVHGAFGGGCFAGLYYDTTLTNFQLQVVDGGTTNTDSGIAYANNTIYRVRLEIYGSTVNSSGTIKFRLYINGTKVVEANLSWPSSTKMRPYLKAASLSTTGGTSFQVGRIRRVWNHLLSNDNL
jgi:sarcosine oxidase delta subunit